MERLEQDLRDVLSDPRRALPVDRVTLEAVHAGAARRRRRRVAGASGLAALVAVAVAVPVWLSSTGDTDESTGPATPTPTAPATTSAPTPSPSDTPTPGEPLAWDGASPLSVTSIGTDKFVVLGSLPQCVQGPCLRLARTEDGGHTFTALAPPPLPVESGEPTPEVRFAGSDDGWTFRSGLGLWSTHDGARSWTKVSLPGSVTNLEAAAGQVWALVADQKVGTETLWRSPANGDGWAQVPSVTPVEIPADLAVSSQWFFVIGPGNAPMWKGGVGANAAAVSSVDSPCPGSVEAHLSLLDDALWAVCVNGTSSSLVRSADSGDSFSPVPLRWLGEAPPNTMLVGARSQSDAIVALPGVGLVQVDGDGTRGATYDDGSGWTYLGMSSRDSGFAISCCSVQDLLVTHDGGVRWQRVTVH